MINPKTKAAAPRRGLSPALILFACCWLTYLTAYLCRTNFSRALQALHMELNISIEALGVTGAVFFLVYACGQIVNGFICDRLPPIPFLMAALVGTALCNACVSLCRTFAAILIFWGINGYFQSMFWSTIIRMLALRIAPEKRSLVSAGISTAMPAGYLLSWCVLGKLLEGSPARLYFSIPALCALPLLGLWLIFAKKQRACATYAQAPAARPTLAQTFGQVKGLLIGKKLWLLLPLCVFHGMIKEGVTFWMPKLIESEMNLSGAYQTLAILLLPLANLIGMLLCRRLLRFSPTLVLSMFFSAIVLACGAMLFSSAGLLIIAMMAFVSGASYGNNTVLMSFLPMQFAEKNLVATLVGLFDFCAYLGAALSTYVLGNVLESAGFRPLPWIWLGISVLSLALNTVIRQKSVRMSA